MPPERSALEVGVSRHGGRLLKKDGLVRFAGYNEPQERRFRTVTARVSAERRDVLG